MSLLSLARAWLLLAVALSTWSLATAETSPSDADGDPFAAGLPRPGNYQQEAADRIEATLGQPLKAPLDFIETPLNQIMAILRDEYDLQIQLDTAAMDALGVSPEAEVSVNLRNVSLASALRLMLQSPATEDLTYIVDHEVLLITSEEEAQSRIEFRVYRVDDLIRADASGKLDAKRLMDLITTSVDQNAWQVNGGGGGTIRALPAGILVVSQTRRVHEEVAALLGEIRDVMATIAAEERSDTTVADVGVQTRAIPIALLPAESETREVLRTTIERSVDWQRQDGLNGEEPYLAFLHDRLIVRHVPSVVAEIEQLIDQLGLGPHRHGGGRGGGGFF